MEKVMSEFKSGELKSGEIRQSQTKTGNSYWSCYGLQGSW